MSRRALTWLAVAAVCCCYAPTSLRAIPAALAADPPAAGQAHGDSNAESGGHKQSNLLAGDLGNVFFTLVIFLVLIAVLGRFAWKPLLNVLEQREHSIRGSLEQAKRERLEAEKLLAQYRQQIDRAREEATSIVDEGKRDAEVVRRRIQDEARQEAEQMVARARREIELAANSAMKELYDRTAELTVQLAGTVARKSLNVDDHRALVTESLERISGSRN